jgi:hypothetical protein
MQMGAETGIPSVVLLLGFYLLASAKCLSLSWKERGGWAAVNGLFVFSGLAGFIVAAQFVTMEGLELPYYIVLVGAATLKLLSVRDDARATGATATPAPAAPQHAGAAFIRA